METSGYEEDILSKYEYENAVLRARVSRLEESVEQVLNVATAPLCQRTWRTVAEIARCALEEK